MCRQCTVNSIASNGNRKRMKRINVTIVNKAGLHARAASRLATLCNRFESSIKVGTDKLVDGKSILSLMMLAAGKGTKLDVIADGVDECAALEAIRELIANRFDEGE